MRAPAHLGVHTRLNRSYRRGGHLSDVGVLGEASQSLGGSAISSLSEHANDVALHIPSASERRAELIAMPETPYECLDRGRRHRC